MLSASGVNIMIGGDTLFGLNGVAVNHNYSPDCNHHCCTPTLRWVRTDVRPVRGVRRLDCTVYCKYSRCDTAEGLERGAVTCSLPLGLIL